jgi:PEP-CTERM motif
MAHLVLIVAALLLLVPAVAAAAPLHYDESVSGDLSPAMPSPTVLPFDLGVNSVRGSLYSGVLAPDFDSFAFTIPAGHSLVSISYAFTLSPKNTETVAKAGWGFDVGNTGLPAELGAVLVDLFGPSPQVLFDGPLPQGGGLYGFYNFSQESTPGLGWNSTYQIDFVVTEAATGVPAPAALLLLGLGILAAAARRRAA